MADDGTRTSMKRRSAATTAAARLAGMTDSPLPHKSGHGPQLSNEGTNSSFTAPPTPPWRGGGDSGCRGGGASPFSGARSPFSGSSSFAPEPNMFLSSSMTSAAVLHPRPRANVAAAAAAAAAVVSNSGGAHAEGGSNGGFTVSGSGVFLTPSLRLLKAKWRRRCSYHRRGLCALLFILFVLLCFLRSRKVNLPGSSSLFSAVEDAAAEDPDTLDGDALEDNLLDISAMGPQEELNGDLSSWSVLVNHTDALFRLNLTSAQRTCLAAEATADCGVAHVHVSRASLPSWTLSTARASSADCAVRKAHATPAAEATLHEPHGVFATSAAPAGRVGPMLFAMSSVTNDVSVRAELPKWSWLRHVHPSLSTRLDGGAEAAAEGGSARRSYLAVMGVPSTDQPARVALRTAQRATWMTYQEVARAENNFDGALLPLYLFAAVEPSKEKTPAESHTTAAKAKEDAGGEDDVLDEEIPHKGRGKTATRTTSTTPPATPAPNAGVRLCGHTDLLLPTVRDFQHASQILAEATGVNGFVQRRVVLRENFKTAEPHMSPCAGVVETRVTASAVRHLPLAQLAHSIDLPITPAAVSPAEYVCCASAGLWQETLEHRNVVWIDMMTDRRPTTKKKLGDTTKWGLPVEVGMSQKLILWLLYAHNSFTDVPYIIKGDDDMYLKVPQFLSDFRLLRRGPRNGRLPPPQHQTDAAHTALAGGEADAAVDMAGTECLYWGSTRRMGNVMFNAGMLFVLQRRLVGVVLECPANRTDTDLLELAAKNYSRSLLALYKRARFNKEDVLMGNTLRERRARAEEVCPKNRILYGKESFKRFHDLRKGRVSPVTWATVVAHRCRPADVYFLHYYFAHELNFSLADVAPGESREEVAREAAAAWAAETQRALPASVTDWRSLPDVVWHHNISAGPAYAMAMRDEVPVYDVAYHWWKDDRTNVRAGYKTAK